MFKMLFTLFIVLPLFAGEIGLNLSIETRYDSNVSILGPGEINEFNELKKPENKYGIKSVNDFIYLPAVELRYLWGISGYRVLNGFNFRFNLFSANGMKNYGKLGAFIRISRFNDNVEIAYSYIPFANYRKFFDPDSGRYEWASYTSNKLILKFTHGYSKKFNFNILFSNELRNYSNTFYEYNYTMPELTTYFEIGFIPTISRLGFSYGALKAQGYDNSNETRENSNEEDISRNEWNFFINILPLDMNGWKILGEVAYSIQDYTSQKDPSLDPLHRDRSDKILSLSLMGLIQVARNTNVTIGSEYFTRKSHSLHYVSIGNLKNYSRFIFYFKVNHKVYR